ncbi:MAG: DUF1467 family protein [Alphaproteobacteria bacterium]|nr:MAG: DUF1467 family protein [Alphaproteobacteria bacterium]
MSTFTAIVTFVVLWWVSFFLVLPFGAHSQADAGEVTPGTEPGAPHQLKLVKKALIATGLAFVFLVIIFATIRTKVFDPFESGRDPWEKTANESSKDATR